MGKNLDILELLDNNPQKYLNRQKFYSPILGDCTLSKLEVYCLQNENKQTIYFKKNGDIIGSNEKVSITLPQKNKDNNPKGKDTPSIEDIFDNALSEKQAAERAKTERDERLDDECIEYTGKMADKFIEEFSFLAKFGLSLVKQMTREDNYYYNYGRKAYSVVIKNCNGSYIMRLHFPQGTGKLITCNTYTDGYYTGTFEEYAKMLTKWFCFSK